MVCFYNVKMTTLLEKLLAIIAPHDCIMCSNEGNMVCISCRGELADEQLCRCHVCGVPSADYAPCERCRGKTALDALYILGSYEAELRELVSRLKFSGARQIAADIAPVLAELLPLFPDETIITHLPTANVRVRQRGFDQAALLAALLGHQLEMRHATLLRRVGDTRQVGTSRAARQKQARHMFALDQPTLLSGATILLIDDVVTTGASMEAGACLLKQAGAETIYGLALAR